MRRHFGIEHVEFMGMTRIVFIYFYKFIYIETDEDKKLMSHVAYASVVC